MKITHLHGMSENSMHKLFNNQGKSECAAPWCVSDNDNRSYLWDIEEYCRINWCHDQSESDKLETVKREAFGSATVQVCIDQSEYIYILLVSIPEDYDYIESDYSCENMDSAYSIPESDLIKFITGAYRVKINKWFIPVWVSGCINNDMFSACYVDPDLLTLAKLINESGTFLDDAHNYPYDTETYYSFDELKQAFIVPTAQVQA